MKKNILSLALLIGMLGASLEPATRPSTRIPAAGAGAGTSAEDTDYEVIDDRAKVESFRNLILLLDPLSDEHRYGFLTRSLFLALRESVAPIITTSNVLKNCRIENLQDALYWRCFIHKQADLVLLFPDDLITEGFDDVEAAVNAYGFNLTNFENFELADQVASSPETMLLENVWPEPDAYELAEETDPSTSPIEELFVKALQDSFNQSQKNIRWNVSLQGHGYAYRGSQTARIAGLSLIEFKKVISFFNGPSKTKNGIRVSFLFYNTCYGGGTNQFFVNKTLDELNAQFIVAAAGINNMPTSEATINPDTKKSYKDFFEKIQNIFSTQNRYSSASFKEVLSAISGQSDLETETAVFNHPFVRFPNIGIFSAVDVDKRVKILTHALVRKHELESLPIEINATPAETIEFIIPCTQRIDVPLIINRSADDARYPTIIAPIKMPTETTVYSFKHIFFNNWVHSTFANLAFFNKPTNNQTIFLISKLEKKDRTGMPIEQNNVILSMQESYVTVLFSLGPNSYLKRMNLRAGQTIDDYEDALDSPYSPIPKMMLHRLAAIFGANTSLPKELSPTESCQALFNFFDEQAGIKANTGGLGKLLIYERLKNLLDMFERTAFDDRSPELQAIICDKIERFILHCDALEKAKQLSARKATQLKDRARSIIEHIHHISTVVGSLFDDGENAREAVSA